MAQSDIATQLGRSIVECRVLRTKARWSHTNGDIIMWDEVQFDNPNDDSEIIMHRVSWGYRVDTHVIVNGIMIEDEDAARKLYHDVGLRGWRGDPRFDPEA